jgi:ubiquinone/menaquinone biosynthesis C-methylase UbiE
MTNRGTNFDMYRDPRMAASFDRQAQWYHAFYERPCVLDLAGDVDGRLVLDACCGPGLYLREFEQRGATVVGFDISRPMLDLAQARLRSAAGLVQASMNEALPFRTGAFDLVVIASAINYADDRFAVLSELRRVMRPGGAIVMSTRHPMPDWMRKGGSYFDTRLEVDDFDEGSRTWSEAFWREPLTATCDAIHRADLLIERLVEPLPDPEFAHRDPSHYTFLLSRPTFVVFRLVAGERL